MRTTATEYSRNLPPYLLSVVSLDKGNKTLATCASDSLIKKAGNRVIYLDHFVLMVPFKDFLEFLTDPVVIMITKR